MPAHLAGPSNSLSPQFQHRQNFQCPEGGIYLNGSAPNMGSPQYERLTYMQAAGPAWNGQLAQQQQPASPAYGAQSSGSLPPPPWEAQSADNDQAGGTHSPTMQVTQVVATHPQLLPQGSQPMRTDQVVGMYIQPITTGQLLQNNQYAGLHPGAIQGGQYMGMLPQPMQGGQMAYMYPQQMYGNQMAGYGCGQQDGTQYLEQRMHGLSLRDDNGLRNASYDISTSFLVPSSKPSKPEDKLFGDLVDIAKLKRGKSTPGRAGSM